MSGDTPATGTDTRPAVATGAFVRSSARARASQGTHAMRTAILAFAVILLACSGAPAAPDVLSAPQVDLAVPLRGVPDNAYDPAVVLLAIDGKPRCTGTLLEEDLVITARRCVEVLPDDDSCPTGPYANAPRDPSTIHVLVGDRVASAIDRAQGREVVLPSGDALCGADLALLLLDAPIDDIDPVVVSPTGAAQGDHVRTVAFGTDRKLVRDHVSVTEASSRELALAQAPCVGLPGGALIDIATGALLGVVSRGGPACSAADGWEVATRADAFFPLVEQALALGSLSHASHRAKEKKGPIDQGASCSSASQCAAGVCVTYADAQYCTRTCGPIDRCPSTTRCMASAQSTTVCVAE